MKKEVYFKVGDKVTCLLYGHGIVEKVIEESDCVYVVTVLFSNYNNETYTFDGRFRGDSNIVLFQGHLDVTNKLPQNKPLSIFQDGELVWINTNHKVQGGWIPAYVEIDKDKRVYFRSTCLQYLYWEYEVKEVSKFEDCPLPLSRT